MSLSGPTYLEIKLIKANYTFGYYVVYEKKKDHEHIYEISKEKRKVFPCMTHIIKFIIP